MLFFFGLGHTKDRCWKKTIKGPTTTKKFLEALVNDEVAILSKLNQIIRNDQHVFFRVKMPKRQFLVPTNHAKDQEEGSASEEHKELITGAKATVKSKIFSHFIKKKIFFSLWKLC
jgi:hypothetical protein